MKPKSLPFDVLILAKDGFKLQEILAEGASVAHVAKRRRVNADQVFRWLWQDRAGELEPETTGRAGLTGTGGAEVAAGLRFTEGRSSMSSLRIVGSRYFAIAATLLLGFVSVSGLVAAPSQTNGRTPAESQKQTPFQIKVTSNLVVVRVVVRDAQGKPVEGLKKEDFKLFDQGKEQTISQFEVETSGAPPSSSVAVHGPGQAASPPSSAMPRRFLALYFDDINTSFADLAPARTAADQYLSANLQAQDRVAIFTSGGMLSDFTADPKQIHDALFELHVSPQARRRQMESSVESMFEELRAPLLARSNLQGLKQVVSYLSQMPGQRTLILISPGFASHSEQFQLDGMIDHALRSQVVISSLDPRGLWTPVHADGSPPVNYAEDAIDTALLREVADGTGGQYFHNDNDLKAGLGELAGWPASYVITFAPSDVKPDGTFHEMKVTLTKNRKGITLQARRGYFAPRNAADAEAETKAAQQTTSEGQALEQAREAIHSKTELQEIPVTIDENSSQGQGDARELFLFTRVDVMRLHFRKEGDRNCNTVIFAFAVFDKKGRLVDTQESQAQMHVLDTQLPALFRTGVSANMSFQLKAGKYRVRGVVTDSEDHRVTAFSKELEIP